MSIGTTSNMEWLVGNGGGGSVEYTGGHGIDIDNVDHIISVDQSEIQDKLTAGEGITIVNNVISANPQRQSDWNQSDTDAVDFIRNKPQNLVQDASYVHTDNNFTNADVSKLGGIESGAEVNVQSNWNETDTGSDAYIQNKPTLAAVATSGSYTDLTDQPTIPSGTQLLPPATSADEDKILSVDENGYPEWVTPGSVQQVQSDWTEDDNTEPSYIQHKPTTKPIQAGTGISVVEYADNIQISGTVNPQVQSNWAESDATKKSFILNKPDVKQIVAGTNVTITEGAGQITISSTGAGGIPVQANWSQSDNSQPDYIQNKPTIPAAQVQSNWTETNTASKSFVLNKPVTKPIVAGTGISITETATEIIISLA